MMNSKRALHAHVGSTIAAPRTIRRAGLARTATAHSASRGPRVAIISDTIDDTNGVAFGLRRFVAASARYGRAISLVGPPSSNPLAARTRAMGQLLGANQVVRVRAAMSASLPIYPEMTWSVPHLPELVLYLSESADLVQLATPGPMGLAGLIAGRMLGLPVIAQYHTEVAEYAARMTGLPMLRAVVGPVVGWFYKQADLCLAPSEAVAQRLASYGLAADRVYRIQRGVDLELFNPSRRDRRSLARYGVGDGPVALYVGRLSKEKNLDVLNAAWAQVQRERPDARLLVVGEGPLERPVPGPGVIEVGPLFGDALATVFASADVFAFPSETETFGNVVVEAAASGIPAVVAARGAAHEIVVDGVTGLVVDGRDPAAHARAVLQLFDDADRRSRLGVAARAHAASYGLDRAVNATWEMYRAVACEHFALKVAS